MLVNVETIKIPGSIIGRVSPGFSWCRRSPGVFALSEVDDAKWRLPDIRAGRFWAIYAMLDLVTRSSRQGEPVPGTGPSRIKPSPHP